MFKSLLLCGALTLAGAGSALADILSDRLEDVNQVFILNAGKVVVKPGATKDTWRLTLTPQSINLVGLSPQAVFGALTGKAFRESWPGAFGDRVVPAVLTWNDKRGTRGVVLSLDKPDLAKATNTLRFTARSDSEADGTLEPFRQYEGNSLRQGTLKQANLYLDQTQARVLRYGPIGNPGDDMPEPLPCVLGPYANCAGAKLAGIKLEQVNLYGINLSDANLTGAVLVNTNLGAANLKRADFSLARLTETDLTNADLTWAILSGARLDRVRLGMALLVGADLLGADLNEVNLDSAKFWYTKMPDGSINNRDCWWYVNDPQEVYFPKYCR